MNEVEFILYVEDQERSKAFYQELLGKSPCLDVPGMTEFELNDHTRLGLMPNQGIATIICGPMPAPDTGTGIPRCELYLRFSDAGKTMKLAQNLGAKLVSELSDRNWGDCVGYLADPDGHIIAIVEKKK